MRALAADVQRLVAEDLLVAASALPSQEAAQAAVQRLLGAVVRELGVLAGAPRECAFTQHAWPYVSSLAQVTS